MGTLASFVGRLLDTKFGEKVFRLTAGLLYYDSIRRPLVRVVWYLTDLFVRAGRRHGTSDRIDREREQFALSVLDTVDRIAGDRAISRDFMEHASLLWVRALIGSEQDAARESFKAQHGVEPPWVLVVAPTGACNLSCPGCYSGASTGGRSMPFDELDRLVTEAKRLWGIKVLVFTGGEPFLYRSENRGILDVVERHPDVLCLIFTNGTLIDSKAAHRLATLGTPTVAVSVEGLRDSTDARRGPGAFDRVVDAMKTLNDAGALIGVSMTATRNNCEELLSDELLDFYFVDNRAYYGFIFQYMPEGRGPDPSLMVTPEQRLWMWRRSWEVIEKRRLPIFDFWNHGTMIGGCAAAGRERGYLYVDWDGNVMPCVFAPYSTCNIHEIYRTGGNLNDAWATPLLAGIRDWQRKHLACDGSDAGSVGSRLVAACPVRDHYSDFVDIVRKSGAAPVGDSADACMASPAFTKQMVGYGQEFADLSGPVLEIEYDSDRTQGRDD